MGILWDFSDPPNQGSKNSGKIRSIYPKNISYVVERNLVVTGQGLECRNCLMVRLPVWQCEDTLHCLSHANTHLSKALVEEPKHVPKTDEHRNGYLNVWSIKHLKRQKLKLAVLVPPFILIPLGVCFGGPNLYEKQTCTKTPTFSSVRFGKRTCAQLAIFGCSVAQHVYRSLDIPHNLTPIEFSKRNFCKRRLGPKRIKPFPWTGKSCFSNRALVEAIFEASNAFKESAFEASKFVSTKTLLLEHYYHRQGIWRPINVDNAFCFANSRSPPLVNPPRT